MGEATGGCVQFEDHEVAYLVRRCQRDITAWNNTLTYKESHGDIIRRDNAARQIEYLEALITKLQTGRS